MRYQVDAKLFFFREDEANDFYHDCTLALAKADVINPCQDDQECSTIDFVTCVHDDHPHGDCNVVDHKDNCPVCG